MTPDEVIRFWFDEHGEKDWFKKSDEFDAKITARFGEAYEQAARGELKEWRATPEGRLAEILILDQFARNMFRASPRAFALDAHAVGLAEDAVQTGDDMRLPARQRRFLYMPFMRSESAHAHKQALWLFLSLPPWYWPTTLYYEWKHKKIIDRFGRYPHRNEILGRESTDEEKEFLKTSRGF